MSALAQLAVAGDADDQGDRDGAVVVLDHAVLTVPAMALSSAVDELRDCVCVIAAQRPPRHWTDDCCLPQRRILRATDVRARAFAAQAEWSLPTIARIARTAPPWRRAASWAHRTASARSRPCTEPKSDKRSRARTTAWVDAATTRGDGSSPATGPSARPKAKRGLQSAARRLRRDRHRPRRRRDPHRPVQGRVIAATAQPRGRAVIPPPDPLPASPPPD